MNRSPLSDSDKSADLMKMALLEEDEQERYLICDTVASGGMGKIYRAYDSHTERYIAYKVIHPELQKNKAIYERFLYESEVAARLEHPNIMPVYDAGYNVRGLPFYTMKLLKGQTLAKLISKLKTNQSTTSVSSMLEILIKICDALACAHGQGIVHRDIKPDNIMIGDFGEVLVLDWGLAKIPQKSDQALDSIGPAMPKEFSQMGAIIGTPAYMAPEQAKGEDVDPRADVYSLGALMQTMLTFKPPVSGNNTKEILAKVSAGNLDQPSSSCNLPDNLGDRNQKIPRSALAVIKKATSLDPTERYNSVDELSQELKKILGGFAVSAENAGAIRLTSLLVQRHKIAAVITLVFTVFFTAFAVNSFNVIQDERDFAMQQHEIAKHNYAEAEYAFRKLKESSGIYLSRAKFNISRGDFDSALMDVQTYLNINKHNAEAYHLLGRINQAQKNYAQAAEAFKKAKQHGDNSDRVNKGIAIASEAQTCVDRHGHLAEDEVFSIYCKLVSNSQLPEASAFLDDLLQNEEFSNRVFNELFRHSELHGTLKFCPKGLIHVSLNEENENFTPLRYFQKAMFGTLSLPSTNLKTLKPISGLAIITLDVRRTDVKCLYPLHNSSVYNLLVDDTQISDFSALKGHQLNVLSIRNTPLKSLKSLRNVNIQHLDIASSPLNNPDLKNLSHIPSLVLPAKWQEFVKEDTFDSKTKVIWAKPYSKTILQSVRMRIKRKGIVEL